jgi:hypothetical protein
MADGNVQIPASTFESLAIVVDLSEEEFAGLLSALDEADSELVDSFVALDRLREAHGWSAAQAAERIAHSDAAPVTSEQDVARLRRRVHALLEASGTARPGGRRGEAGE